MRYQIVNKTDGIIEVSGVKIPAKTSITTPVRYFKEKELSKINNIEVEKKGHFVFILTPKEVETTKEVENIDIEKMTYDEMKFKASEIGIELKGNPKKEVLKQMLKDRLKG